MFAYFVFPAKVSCACKRGMKLFTQTVWVRRRAQTHPAIYSVRALITAGVTWKDCGMSGRIHSQWHCSAAPHSLHTTPPSKKCHPLWPPSTHSKSTPLRSVQLKHTTKPREQYRTSFFSQAVPPSSPFGEKKPTCVSALS